jgi:hypothetical protein
MQLAGFLLEACCIRATVLRGMGLVPNFANPRPLLGAAGGITVRRRDLGHGG